MQRKYHKWHSQHLNREMELLQFGYGGAKVIFFPTRCARFYDYENWKVLDDIHDKITKGFLQIFCVDSIDQLSFYDNDISPSQRIKQHLKYENYIIKELIPFIDEINNHECKIVAGCSMGAFHAINLAFKYPELFCKVVGMSGRYDLTQSMGSFKDLFDGFYNKEIYLNSPSQYLSNLKSKKILNNINKLEITLAVGETDVFLENNKFLSNILSAKNINHSLFIWDNEAHKPPYWRKMVQLYI